MLMAGKIYALSDLHGHYEILLAILRKIRFDASDTFYILGDCNGGVRTLEQMEAFLRKDCISDQDFHDKRKEFRTWLVESVNSLPSFLELNVGGQPLVLIHAGINPEASLYEQDEEICAWVREWFYLSPAIKEKTIIFGHTPLCYINSNHQFDVWFDPVYHDKIGIDGGIGPFENGQLNCICLNDLSVTVVKKEEICRKHRGDA